MVLRCLTWCRPGPDNPKKDSVRRDVVGYVWDGSDNLRDNGFCKISIMLEHHATCFLNNLPWSTPAPYANGSGAGGYVGTGNVCGRCEGLMTLNPGVPRLEQNEWVNEKDNLHMIELAAPYTSNSCSGRFRLLTTPVGGDALTTNQQQHPTKWSVLDGDSVIEVSYQVEIDQSSTG